MLKFAEHLEGLNSELGALIDSNDAPSREDRIYHDQQLEHNIVSDDPDIDLKIDAMRSGEQCYY